MASTPFAEGDECGGGHREVPGSCWLMERPGAIRSGPCARSGPAAASVPRRDAVAGPAAAPMTLPARDRRALESISEGLAGSDPGLVRLAGMFTRLADGEEMPSREQMSPLRLPAARSRRRPGGSSRSDRLRLVAGVSLSRRRPALAPMLMLLWLAVTVMFVAVAVALNTGGAPGCNRSLLALCARPAHAVSTPPASPGDRRPAGLP
jgi:hypothetical protein